MIIKIQFDGIRPQQSSEEAAGWDCFAYEACDLMPQQIELVSLGFRTEIEKGWCALLRPRSGLASQGLIMAGSGIIDSDYRGYWKFAAYNVSQEIKNIGFGLKLCQFIVIRVPEILWVNDLLNDSGRGIGGPGSYSKDKGDVWCPNCHTLMPAAGICRGTGCVKSFQH